MKCPGFGQLLAFRVNSQAGCASGRSPRRLAIPCAACRQDPNGVLSSQALLIVGCTMRVGSEILAYQQYLQGAWSWLPVSAVIELSAVTIFAINMVATFIQPAPTVACAGK